MNEEEIKAIKSIGLELEMTGDMPRIILYRKDIKKVLKIIEKQQGVINSLNFRIVRQEECIKELKKKNETQPDRAEPVERAEEMVNMKWINHNFISKDKIKAKIEEIDEVLKDQLIEKIRVYFEAQKEVLQSLLENETQPDRAEPVERTEEQEVTKKVTKKVVKKITYKGEEFGHGATQEVVDDIDDYCTAINGLIDGLAIKINEIIDYLTSEVEANPDKQKTKRKEKK